MTGFDFDAAVRRVLESQQNAADRVAARSRTVFALEAERPVPLIEAQPAAAEVSDRVRCYILAHGFSKVPRWIWDWLKEVTEPVPGFATLAQNGEIKAAFHRAIRVAVEGGKTGGMQISLNDITVEGHYLCLQAEKTVMYRGAMNDTRFCMRLDPVYIHAELRRRQRH